MGGMNPLIISGMHRSGTSAVARLVQQLGWDVGSNLLPATEGNIHGHFEEAAFIRFHDTLIALQFPKRAPFCEWLPLADGDILYRDEERTQARAIWDAHRAAGGSAWKDPRTSLFLDLWTEVLSDAKVIVCLRHPYQVHLSLLRRGEPFLHADYSAAILGWTVYNQRILQAISALPRERVMVLDVEAAFKDPRQLAEELARFLGVPALSAAFEAIAPEVFHFDDDTREALPYFGDYFPEAGAAYRQLKQFDFLHPVALSPGANKSPIRSSEARLMEFEEAHHLRARAKKMLIRSIAVDRKRTLALYEQAMKVGAEKDRLIEDLSRLNEQLERAVPLPSAPAF